MPEDNIPVIQYIIWVQIKPQTQNVDSAVLSNCLITDTIIYILNQIHYAKG